MHVSALLESPGQRRFRRFARVLLGYLLLVILFGAWVRITGSGAGCGDHWPSCRGEILPRSPSGATLIEYSHRLSSGLLGLLALALPVAAFRSFPRGHTARRWSLATLALIGVEAAIGAGLVKNQLVADDASVARAVVVALHLVNTLLLSASAALAAFSPAALPPGAAPVPAGVNPAAARWLLGAVLVGLGLVAASGAVTALGDTLFPVPPALEQASGGGTPAQHFLIQLRVVHPLLACVLVCAALVCAQKLADPGLGVLAALQFVLGGVNVLLGAPGWLQLLHLLLAQLLWISAVLAAQRLWSAPGSQLAAAQRPSPVLGPVIRP